MDYMKEEIIDYLSKRKFLTLATMTEKNEPLTHALAYVNKGDTIYFSTGKETRKFKNIQKNPNVAYSVFDLTEHLDEARSVQMEGAASIVSDKKEIDEVVKLLKKKFPSAFIVDLTKDYETVVIKISPKACYYIDYTKGFGHRAKIKY
jgi:nitroimidazol reductase NimA-like FMN-containing flavoprotein (pyridoxamine 5'-phosphate oxidase superfamily)